MKSFWQTLEDFKDAPCVEGEACLSYCEVASLADGVFPIDNSNGNRKALALVLCGRNVATFLGYLACLRAEVVPILLPEDMGQDNLLAYITRYKPRYIWCSKSLHDEFDGLTGDVVNHLHSYVLVDLKLDASDPQTYELYEQLALLLTTSGSTADPKLVRLSYTNIQANADSIAEYLNIDNQSKPITLLPFNYSFGLSVINSHLNRGACIVFTNEGLTARGFWDTFKQCAVTSFYGVPYHYEILKKFRFERQEYPSLSLMAQAGGRISESLKQEFYALSKTKGFQFICMYGQTEATARISYLPPDQFELKSKSVGVAIPKGTLSIRQPDVDQIGEVAYTGPNVSLGYATCGEELALGDVNQGSLLTGDLGYLDEDGYLFLTGRKKRYVKVFGHNVNLDHVESIVHELVAGAAVIGQDNEVWVLTTQGKSDEIKQVLLNKTTIQPSALKIQQVETLLYKSSGKIDYGELTARYIVHD